MRNILAGIAGGIAMFIWRLLFPYCSAARRSRRQNAAERTPLMAALRPPNICSTGAAPTSAATTTNISGGPVNIAVMPLRVSRKKFHEECVDQFKYVTFLEWHIVAFDKDERVSWKGHSVSP